MTGDSFSFDHPVFTDSAVAMGTGAQAHLHGRAIDVEHVIAALITLRGSPGVDEATKNSLTSVVTLVEQSRESTPEAPKKWQLARRAWQAVRESLHAVQGADAGISMIDRFFG